MSPYFREGTKEAEFPTAGASVPQIQSVSPGMDGVASIEIRELERITIYLDPEDAREENPPPSPKIRGHIT